MNLVFVFLDGVGIGPADPARNPFLSAALPTLREWLGGTLPTLARPRLLGSSPGATARTIPLDAGLGIAGRPQSGTGQTALLTGENAAALFGRHFGPWTPSALRPLLAERNVLVRARAEGLRIAFANAYPHGYLDGVPTRLQAAPPLAAQAAGVLDRDHRHLARGQAVASEIVNDGWRNRLGFGDLPDVSAREAGRNLAHVAGSHDLTFYAHYRTDQAGHDGTLEAAHDALERVDSFLGGLMEALASNTLLVVASDHGNIEELDGRHTENPVLGLIVGKGGEASALVRDRRASDRLMSIRDVPGALLRWVGAGSGAD